MITAPHSHIILCLRGLTIAYTFLNLIYNSIYAYNLYLYHSLGLAQSFARNRSLDNTSAGTFNLLNMCGLEAELAELF